jgi:hypothetical protein
VVSRHSRICVRENDWLSYLSHVWAQRVRMRTFLGPFLHCPCLCPCLGPSLSGLSCCTESPDRAALSGKDRLVGVECGTSKQRPSKTQSNQNTSRANAAAERKHKLMHARGKAKRTLKHKRKHIEQSTRRLETHTRTHKTRCRTLEQTQTQAKKHERQT